jgi:hypothetical protein
MTGYRYCVQRKVGSCWVDAPGWLNEGHGITDAMNVVERGKYDYQTYTWRILWKNPSGDIEVKHEEYDVFLIENYIPHLLIIIGIFMLLFALAV